MRWPSLLVLLGCSSPLAPVVPIIDVWFEDVPVSQYYYDANTWYAFQAHATQTPADTTYWMLEAETDLGWIRVDSGKSNPGERAGHRFYVARHEPMSLKITAWGPSVGPVISNLDYKGGL